ncbi:MAG: SIMPL domain-containing protein [Isosphaeraceae bacterium]
MKTLTAAGVMILVASASVSAQEAHHDDGRPQITVSGDAAVNVRPNKIVINLGIETSDKDIEVAKQKNNEIQRKTVAVIKQCEVPLKDVQMDYLSIDPRYKDNDRNEGLIGYFVRSTLVVTLNNPAKVEELITKALNAGVNHVHGIDFQTTDFTKYREQARELALRAAKEKAEKMASVLGQSIGRPIQISEGYSSWWFFSSWTGWGFGRSTGMSQVSAQVGQQEASGDPDSFPLGQIAIRASVSVTFELKQ